MISTNSKFKKCNVTLTTPFLQVICPPYAGTWYSLPVRKIRSLELQPFQRQCWYPLKCKWLTWPQHAPFWDDLYSMGYDSIKSTCLFCSWAILDPRVSHIMDILSPFISVLCHSDLIFHWEYCPRIDVVHPGRAWSPSPACTWHCSLHYLFLPATSLFPHGVTIVC